MNCWKNGMKFIYHLINLRFGDMFSVVILIGDLMLAKYLKNRDILFRIELSLITIILEALQFLL